MSDLRHFTLFCRVQEQPRQHGNSLRENDSQGGRWYFRIQADDGQIWLEASDTEVGVTQERLELLAVVRGLEAFDAPSLVTLVTPNPQISRSVRQGLDYWRDRDWMWERFGEKVPMTNRDLWQRVDRAIQIHTIRSKTYRIDRAQASPSPSRVTRLAGASATRNRRPMTRPLAAATRIAANGLHRIADSLISWTPEASKPYHAA